MVNRKRKFKQQSSNGFIQQRQFSRRENIRNVRRNVEPPSKKAKVERKAECKPKTSVHQGELDLSTFRITQILDSNDNKKEIILKGEFEGYDSWAIVILEKKISELLIELQMEFFGKNIYTKTVSINDVYGDYVCFPKDAYTGWKMRIIHPASQMHLNKYAGGKKKVYLVNETYEMYEKFTQPYIESEALSAQWVNDVLNHRAEKDKIIYEDDGEETGFVMLPDLKWNGSLKKIDLLIIARKKIKSLRDLNETHLPLLMGISDLGIAKMKEKYDLLPSQFKMTVHYLPSYYHFHVLISTSMFKNQSEHLLSTVIDNIKLLPDYYQKVQLPMFIKDNHPLCEKYQQHGIIPR